MSPHAFRARFRVGLFVAIACVAAAWLRVELGHRDETPAPVGPTDGGVAQADDGAPEPPLARPAAELVEIGVLGPAGLPDRERLAARVTPESCGDATACSAVRAAILDPRATEVAAGDASAWMARIDAGAIEAGAAVPLGGGGPRALIVVRVQVAPSERHLALRTAFAAAWALASDTGGLVVDPLLGRVEDATAFAAHATTEALGASLVRPDRLAVREEARGDGVVRLRTAGLSRWGAPDLEIVALPEGAREAGIRLLLQVAAEIVPGGADAAAATVVPVAPSSGDAGDLLARIEPPGGEGPIATLELVERLYGPTEVVARDDASLQARGARAQRDLARALDYAAAPAAAREGAGGDAAPGEVWVRLPFAIPGGGAESLWVRVTRHDAETVSGTLDDDPLAATDLTRGAAVTRRRAEVEAVRTGPPAP